MTSAQAGGLIALPFVALITVVMVVICIRALRTGRIPVNRRWIAREQRPAAYWMMVSLGTLMIGYGFHRAIIATVALVP